MRDRVLQTKVYLALLPICETQADPLSFGYRFQRNAHQAIALIASRLLTSLNLNTKSQGQ